MAKKKQNKYNNILGNAVTKLGSEAKFNTLLSQLKTAVVGVANPYFTASRQAATKNAKADTKTKKCLCIQALGPYFNNVNSKAVMKSVKKAANANDFKTFKSIVKAIMPILKL